MVLAVLTRRSHEDIDDDVAPFAEEFTFKDGGIGLEFKDKEWLTEFFLKTREYFPDSSSQVDSILVSLDHVVSEWTLHTSMTANGKEIVAIARKHHGRPRRDDASALEPFHGSKQSGKLRAGAVRACVLKPVVELESVGRSLRPR